MGSGQSKYWAPLPYSCHEVGHTWHPSCTTSTVEVGLTSLFESAKIYASVYAVRPVQCPTASLSVANSILMILRLQFSALMRGRRLGVEEVLALLSHVAQSTLFLFYNTFGFVAAFCTVR